MRLRIMSIVGTLLILAGAILWALFAPIGTAGAQTHTRHVTAHVAALPATASGGNAMCAWYVGAVTLDGTTNGGITNIDLDFNSSVPGQIYGAGVTQTYGEEQSSAFLGYVADVVPVPASDFVGVSIISTQSSNVNAYVNLYGECPS